MYEVSAAYINKLKSASVKQRRIRGQVDNIPFTENDILAESFQYSDIAVNSADIKLGGVFISTLNITFLESFTTQIARGTWKGRTITAHVDLLIDQQNDIWEQVPLKPYTIEEANHSALGVDVKAYDNMAKFDATIAMNTTAGSLYGMLTLACNNCGVTLGMTEEEVEALPNGTQILGLYPDSDIETWRDLVSWAALTAGGFATINRNGELEIRTWHAEPDLEIGINDRFTGGSWSDFSTNYTAVKIKYIESGTVGYYAEEQDTGLTLDLGSNPLMQYGVPETKEAQARAILTALQNMKYTPFKSQSLIDPALDLADVITYSDGIARNAKCCVMRLDFSFRNGATVQGYGKNPSLNGARDRHDKALAQAASQQKSQGITYYTYVNTRAVALTTTAQRLYKISFATVEQTDVDLWHEVKWDVETVNDTPVNIIYEYYLDGVKFDYEPEETWSDGIHTMPHPFWLMDVEGGLTHEWEVRAKLTSGSATAAIGDVHALLKGQKLVGAVAFDGNIEVEDEYTPFNIGQAIIDLTDNVAITRKTAGQALALSDTNAAWIIGQNIVTLAENMNLTGRAIQYNRITTDGDRRVTNDGDPRTTSH